MSILVTSRLIALSWGCGTDLFSPKVSTRSCCLLHYTELLSSYGVLSCQSQIASYFNAHLFKLQVQAKHVYRFVM